MLTLPMHVTYAQIPAYIHTNIHTYQGQHAAQDTTLNASSPRAHKNHGSVATHTQPYTQQVAEQWQTIRII